MKKVFCLSLALLILLSACTDAPSKTADEPLTWQEQYDLGLRYLAEGKYEEAIIAFTAAIDIDPKRPEAYMGLADAYIALERTEEAIDALRQGVAATGDAELQARLEALENGETDAAEAGNVETSTTELPRMVNYYTKEGEKRCFEGTYRPDGKLDVVTLTVYGETGEIKSQSSVQNVYDKNGRIAYGYDSLGAYFGKWTWSEDGLHCEAVDDRFSLELVGTRITYNSDGEEIEEEFFDENGVNGRYVYVLDATGNCVEDIYYDGDGNEQRRRRYEDTYDTDGRIIRSDGYRTDRSLSTYYEYDAANDREIRREEWHEREEKWAGCYTYEYDADGRKVSQKSYDENGKLFHEAFY